MPPTLIDVGTLPGDDMSPEAIRGGATSLRTVGDKAFGDSVDVVKTWSGIAHSYEAPESGELVAAMGPVKTSAATLDRNLCSAADALDTFAEAVRAVKKACDGIRTQANALRATVDANGKVGAVGPFPGTDWYHDPVTSGRNDALIAAVSEQAALLKAAERACAAAIEGLVGGGQHGEHGGPGFATAPAVENPSWGHVTTRQDVLDVEGPGQTEGVAQQSLQTLAGLVALVGFDTSRYQVVDGKPQGELFGSWSVHNIITNLEGIGQAFAHPVKTFEAMGKDLTAWDDWADRPSFALGRVLVNAGLIGASFLKVGTLSRIGSAGREAADAAGAGSRAASEAEQAASRAGRLARTVEIGQRAGQKVVVATVDGLKDLARATKDKVWTATLDRLDKAITALHHDVDVDHPNAPEHAAPAARDIPADHGLPDRGAGPAAPGGSDHQPTPGHHEPDAINQHDHGTGDDGDVPAPTHHDNPAGTTASAHDLGGTGTKQDPKRYWFRSPAEHLRGAPRPSSEVLDSLKSYKSYTAGTAEHMNARWKVYDANPDSKLGWDAWRNRYIANQGNHYKGLAFEDVVVHEKGLQASDIGRHTGPDHLDRDYDIYSDYGDAYEIKANGVVDEAQVAKDALARDAGIDVHYVFGKEPTPRSVRLLEEAGIPWEVVYTTASPVR